MLSVTDSNQYFELNFFQSQTYWYLLIRDMLGHANISTTEIYARADAEMKRKAL